MTANESARFQFNLLHAGIGMFIICVYFSLVRVIGEYPATLALGLLVIAWVTMVCRIENMLVGGMVGLFLAIGILLITSLAFPPAQIAMTWLANLCYPSLGYTAGLCSAADRQFREG